MNRALKVRKMEDDTRKWQELPEDILPLIIKHFHTPSQLSIFRSICGSWRIFASPHRFQPMFPVCIPPLPLPSISSRPFFIYPSFIYLLSPTTNPQNIWLLKAFEMVQNRWTILNPLTNRKLGCFPSGVRRYRTNLLDFRRFEVGRGYSIQYVDELREDIDGFDCFPLRDTFRKIVVNDSNFGSLSVLGWLTNGQIVVWELGNKESKWVNIEIENDLMNDIICFKDEFYVVDGEGRLWMVNSSSSSSKFELVEVAGKLHDGNSLQYSYLVESNSDLYLVLNIIHDYSGHVGRLCKPLTFNVFVFNGTKNEWQRVESLGNRVFFLNCHCSFSVCHEDLGWNKGNCIYFEGITGIVNASDFRCNEICPGVYDMENKFVSYFSSRANPWTKIFYPTSTWFA